MAQKKQLLLILPLIALFLVQCETPGSPDFVHSSTIETPLILESSFKFLGGTNALIDTTGDQDLQDLFIFDGDSFITLAVEEEFNFGDLDDAIPLVNVEPTSFEAQVGEISLTDFSSEGEDGNLGEADFEQLTGISDLEEGDPIPGASTQDPVNIDLETDFFVSAMIKSGGIEVTIKNDLGFDLDELRLELFSGNTSLGTISMFDFIHDTRQSDTFILIDNPDTDPEVELRDININVEIEWSTQTMQADAGSLIIQDVQGADLLASSVEAVVPQQDFMSSGVTDFSDEEFLFTDPSHYVEMQEGELSIQNILNSMDIDIELLEITFPNIQLPPYGTENALVIRFEGQNRIVRNNTEPVSQSVSLENARIFAFNNEVTYDIVALTEDTQQNGSSARVISESDVLSAEVDISGLKIKEAFGVAVNKQILLGEDDSSNGESLDLANDNEAEIIEIDGIDDISRKLDGLEFTNSSLSINYFTNVDIPTRVIGAFLGVDASGNEFFLRGASGSELEVEAGAETSQLRRNGTPVDESDLIKFDLDGDGNVDTEHSIVFDRNNSSITDFLNALPVEIRFIGLADINSTGTEEGRIINPVVFDPQISVNIPLSIRTVESATYVDTLSSDLSDLPGPQDDLSIIEGSISVRYTNVLPLGVGLSLQFLDENDDVLTSLPLEDAGNRIQMAAASVGSNGFVSGERGGNTEVTLNRSQLDVMNLTRSIQMTADITTTDQQEVKIRSTDAISFSVNGKFSIQNAIN